MNIYARKTLDVSVPRQSQGIPKEGMAEQILALGDKMLRGWSSNAVVFRAMQ